MITKRHYTKKGRHPEDLIYDEGIFIRRTNEILSHRFDKLVKDLRLNETGSDWLFDYIYNCDDDTIGFEDFLNKAGLDYADFIK